MTYYQVKPEYDGFAAWRPLVGGELFTDQEMVRWNLKRYMFSEVDIPKSKIKIVNKIRTYESNSPKVQINCAL